MRYFMQIDPQQALMVFIIPYTIWVTVSLFNQRQELALLRVAVQELKEMVKEFRSSMISQHVNSKD